MDNAHETPGWEDEAMLRWSFLEDEEEACFVLSPRMEFVFANAAGRRLLPGEWFGKRCFELLPVVDEACAFHCPKITAVNTSTEVVYCEETLYPADLHRVVLGVGLIPLPSEDDASARAALLMRRRDEADEPDVFKTQLLRDANTLRQRIAKQFT